MARRASIVLDLYRGDDFDHLIGVWEHDGGPIVDAQIVSGSNQLVSTAGVRTLTLVNGALVQGVRGFNTGDINTQVTLLTGAGIADGTTITGVASNGLSATMSAAATATQDHAIVVVRARDVSNYTMTAQCRTVYDSTVLFNITVETPRLRYGAIHLWIPSEATRVNRGLSSATQTTATIQAGGGVDIQWVDTDGYTQTPIVGKVVVSKDWTHV